MPNTIVVALRFSRRHKASSFDDQLKAIIKKIRTICGSLKVIGAQAKKWIIVWQEYGITQGDSDFISSEQKSILKCAMADLSDAYPKLTIISPVATTRVISGENSERMKRKVDGLRQTYDDYHQLQSTEFLQHKADFERYSKHNFTLVRNTAYFFKQGECCEKRHKITGWKESRGISQGVFRPGDEKTLLDVAKRQKVVLEICLEHAQAVCAGMKEETFPPLHIIVSDYTYCVPGFAVSPNVIQVDSMAPPILLTDIPLENLKVHLYTSNIDIAELCFVYPQTMRSYAKSTVKQSINGQISKALFDADMLADTVRSNKGTLLLMAEDFHALLRQAAQRYNRLFDDKIEAERLRLMLQRLLELSPDNTIFAPKAVIQSLLENIYEDNDIPLLVVFLCKYQTDLLNEDDEEFQETLSQCLQVSLAHKDPEAASPTP